MKSKTFRLDRFVSRNSDFAISDVRLLVAQKRIYLDNEPAHSVQQLVGEFTRVDLDGVCIQNNKPVYLMLNKPKGVVCATRDNKHQTVLDLIDHPQKQTLHIAGRLDFNTTGLVLLTNDGAWSRHISLPQSKLEKTYEVRLSKPLSQDYVDAFKRGIYFAFEDITTQPARLEIVSDYCAKLSIVEGKYHQVKRMFGRFQNEVLELHRISVGHFCLGDLKLGQSRLMSAENLVAGCNAD